MEKFDSIYKEHLVLEIRQNLTKTHLPIISVTAIKRCSHHTYKWRFVQNASLTEMDKPVWKSAYSIICNARILVLLSKFNNIE